MHRLTEERYVGVEFFFQSVIKSYDEIILETGCDE